MKPSIGIEIEVNWSAYFPQEYAEWFFGGKRKYADFDDWERVEFDVICTRLDARMLPLLEHNTRELGLTRGKDAYWEFVFPPLSDIQEIVRLIEMLHTQGVLPLSIPHSLHLTVANLVPDNDCALLATCLEILSGVTAERLRTGIHSKDPNFLASWARRWNRGMRARPKSELLLGAERAVEFRIPVVPGTITEIRKLLEFTQKFGETVEKIQMGWSATMEWKSIREWLGHELQKHWLDIKKDWGNPTTHGEIWKKYADFLSTEEAENQRKMLCQVEL